MNPTNKMNLHARNKRSPPSLSLSKKMNLPKKMKIYTRSHASKPFPPPPSPPKKIKLYSKIKPLTEPTKRIIHNGCRFMFKVKGNNGNRHCYSCCQSKISDCSAKLVMNIEGTVALKE